MGGYWPQSTTWHMRDGMADKFWKAIYASTGIDKANIEFGDVDHVGSCDFTDCENYDHDYNFQANTELNQRLELADLIRRGSRRRWPGA